MAPADFLQLDRQLCFALHAASRAMTQAYQPVLAPLGLTYPQYLVMLVLWEQDGRSVGELGQQLCLDSGTLSPLLRRLQSRGLLERRRDPDDERRVTLHLTRDGWALRRRARNIPESLGRKIVDDPAAYLQLHAQLTQIAERLEA